MEGDIEKDKERKTDRVGEWIEGRQGERGEGGRETDSEREKTKEPTSPPHSHFPDILR